MSILLSICLGVGLASAAGFRVFVPLLALSLGAYYHVWPLNASWQWLGTPAALVIFGVASVVESLAYLIPWVDNLLDTIAVPLAGVAGTVMMASTVTDMNPAFTWALAIIAGGGAAAAIKGTAAATRLAATAATGGLANPIVSVAETSSAIFLSALSIFMPVLAVILAGLLAFIGWRAWRRVRNRQSARA